MGRMPRATEALPMPLTTSLIVPSPPAATIVPKPCSTARSAPAPPASPGPEVVLITTLRVSRWRLLSRALAPRAAGLTMMQMRFRVGSGRFPALTWRACARSLRWIDNHGGGPGGTGGSRYSRRNARLAQHLHPFGCVSGMRSRARAGQSIGGTVRVQSVSFDIFRGLKLQGLATQIDPKHVAGRGAVLPDGGECRMHLCLGRIVQSPVEAHRCDLTLDKPQVVLTRQATQPPLSSVPEAPLTPIADRRNQPRSRPRRPRPAGPFPCQYPQRPATRRRLHPRERRCLSSSPWSARK